MTHYVVTGGHGFIGTNLCRRLEDMKMACTIVDREQKDDPLSVQADVCYKMPSLEGDILVHLAAETNVRESLKDPRNYICNNIGGLLNVLDAARNDNYDRLVFTSSASAKLVESPYLASKSCCEDICKAYQNTYNLNIQILRLSSVYGPHSIHKQSVIHKFIKACIRREPMVIYGDGRQMRDFIHVEDVVSSIIKGKSGFISTGNLISINMLAHKVAELSEVILGFTPKIKHINAIPGEVRSPVPRSDLDYSISLEEGLYSTFKWYKENFI